MSYIEDSEYFKRMSENKVKCRCGHSQLVLYDKQLCRWCGNWVFKNKKEEFKHRVKENIRRVK